MRFIDEARISVFAGHGGPGCVSFRREKFVPRGGPDGGEGGSGGSVRFVASRQLTSLQDFRYRREYRAGGGKPGSGGMKAGKDGEDLEVRVPVGTIARDAETGEVLHEFLRDEEEWFACRGGRGGKGNSHFVTSTFQAPKFAQPGEEGETRRIDLELKLLADAGIIGFPNAGKSTLISRLSAARPKIADYPFTTLVPHLGVVALDDQRHFVLADFPGLVEGAHEGTGLGHRFLRHLERARVLVHLVDGSAALEDPEAPARAYAIIRRELAEFRAGLPEKPELVALNKADLFAADPEPFSRARDHLAREIARARELRPGEPWVLSAVAGEGTRELSQEIARVLGVK